MEATSDINLAMQSDAAAETILGNSTLGKDFLRKWFDNRTIDEGQHVAIMLRERTDGRENVDDELRVVFRDHYVSKEVWESRIIALGAPKTGKLLGEMLPQAQKARSGETGEILAVEAVEQLLFYKVPIRKLRWKDGRETPLHGDDLFAISLDEQGYTKFLKGESKSRIQLYPNVIEKAAKSLDSDQGRPNSHTVVFVASRLREQGQDKLATELDDAVLEGFANRRIEHLLFVLSGNDTERSLINHLREIPTNTRKRFAIGIRICDHKQFISNLYDSL